MTKISKIIKSCKVAAASKKDIETIAGKGSYACFIPSQKIIYMSPRAGQPALYHEQGHAIYASCVDLQIAWDKEYRKHKKSIEKLISLYGCTDSEEGFCEAYSLHMTNKKKTSYLVQLAAKLVEQEG